MIYMDSKSANDGSYTLTVTFDVGTAQDIAAVDVQNQVAIAQRAAAARRCCSRASRGQAATADPDHRRASAPTIRATTICFCSNYATLHVYDALARVRGVGQVAVFGARDYGMRIWLDPERWRAWA